MTRNLFILHDYPAPQFQNIAIPLMAFSPHSFKVLPALFMEFLWITIPS